METTNAVWQGISRRRGVPEVSVEWVSNNIDRVRVVDVREPAELHGPLGRIENSENVPLGDLGQAHGAWDRDEPLVVLCRSGGRSARAAAYLEQQGFTRVASMDGGMLSWQGRGLPTA